MFFLSKQEIKKITLIALEAGKIAKSYFLSKKILVKKKSDKSIVTNADKEISDFIYKNLNKIFPNIPIICEERRDRSTKEKCFFLIDPIDGTESFVAGKKEYTINIGLIKNQMPYFGIINAPEFDVLYYNTDNEITKHCNISQTEKVIQTPKKSINRNYIRIITSRRTTKQDVEEFIEKTLYNFYNKNTEFVIKKISSSIKFCKLLEGDAEVYFHPGNTMPWDIAAGYALIKNRYKLVNLETNKEFFFRNDIVKNGRFYTQDLIFSNKEVNSSE